MNIVRIVGFVACEDKMEIDSVGEENQFGSDHAMDVIESNDTEFQILPIEIVLKIFSHLGEDLILAGRVCKFWNAIAFKELYDRGMYEMEVLQDNFTAINQFTLAIKLNPTCPTPWFKRGISYYKESEDQIAIRDINKGLSLNPTDVDAHLMRAMIYQIQLQFPLAVEEASKAIEVDPENGAAYYLRGYNRFDLQDYEGSITDLSFCLQLPYPYKSKVLNCRGWCYKIRGDLNRALEDFTLSSRLNIRYTKPFVNKAMVLYAKNQRDGVMEEEKLLTDYIENSSDRSNIGSVYYTRGAIRQQWENYRGAIEDYLASVTNNYHSPHKSYVSVGWCCEKLQDFKQAIEYYNMAISVKPSYSIAIEHRAGAKCRTDTKAAEEDCKLAIKTNPKNLSFAFRYLAAVQADGTDYINAIKILTEGLKVNPLDNDMLLNRAGYFTCQGDLANSIRDYDACLKHRPDTFDAWKYRANVKFAFNDLTGAMNDYLSAFQLDINNNDVAVLNNCAMVIFALGDFDKATEFINKALAAPSASSFAAQLHQNFQLIKNVREKQAVPKQFTPHFAVDPVFEKELSKKMKDCVKCKLSSVLKGTEHSLSLKQRVLGWRKRARVHV